MSQILSPKLHRNGDLLMFWCPGCDERHMVRIGGQGWQWNGDAERPTLSPSILVQGNPDVPVCHSFVRDGNIQFCSDSSHSLTGKTVPLPDFPY